MKLILALLVFFSWAAVAADPIPLDPPWKKAISDFAEKNLQHSAWGFGHSRRNYLLSLNLAKEAGLKVDTDVLFAAAFLHDMGGFPAFEQKGVDHAVRSAQLVEPILRSAGFPAAKIGAVKATILAHTYYNTKPPVTPEEIVFRDADVLDFLGAIGVARIVSVTTRESFAASLKDAVAMVDKLRQTLGAKLILNVSQREGANRLTEMTQTLRQLHRESFGGLAY
jgi:uncharacterized protein